MPTLKPEPSVSRPASRPSGGRRRGWLIAVEGLDFSGKTTTCRFVADELTSQRVPVTVNSVKSRFLRRLAKRLERAGTGSALVDVLFLLAVILDTGQIALRRLAGTSVVQDRYLPSYIWHQTAVRTQRTPWLPLYRLLSRLVVPDLTIYCDCSAETLWARYGEALRQPGSITYNDGIVYAEGPGAQLVHYRQGFEQAITASPNVVVVRNDASMDDLRRAVRGLVSTVLAGA